MPHDDGRIERNKAVEVGTQGQGRPHKQRAHGHRLSLSVEVSSSGGQGSGSEEGPRPKGRSGLEAPVSKHGAEGDEDSRPGPDWRSDVEAQMVPESTEAAGDRGSAPDAAVSGREQHPAHRSGRHGRSSPIGKSDGAEFSLETRHVGRLWGVEARARVGAQGTKRGSRVPRVETDKVCSSKTHLVF